jgi:predicted DNA-binding helix-hairpin-helix protein
MSISEISLYKALRIKLGDEAANDLVEFVASEVKTELDNKTNIFLTKEDKIDLIDRINKAKTETIIWIVGIGVLQFILTNLAKFLL